MNPKVDWYFEKADKWQEEIALMREIALACGLNEELKWGCPSYSFNGKNVILIHTFKEYCAFLFFKGALLKDPENILIQQTANVQSARQARFTNVQAIQQQKDQLTSYIFEAIEVEKAGLKVPMKKTTEFAMPEEFEQKLKADQALKHAFESLTPGRQRAYLLYFGQAKQAKTREARIEKWTEQILMGKGLDD